MMGLNLLFSVLLVSAVAVLGKPAQEDGGSCDVASYSRQECGWFGIDEATCVKRGCCWDNGTPNAKYCFVKKGSRLEEGQCPVAPSERVECGFDGITKQQCLEKLCCWDDAVDGAKYCFREPSKPAMGCYIYHGVSGFCRYFCKPGESKMYGMGVCDGRICCY